MKTTRSAAALLAPIIALGASRPLAGQQVVTLETPSPLLEIRVMVKAGSTADHAGKEGLAALTARGLLQGGFGSAADPVTKEELAEMTRPWGSRAQPRVFPEKETTTFVMTVPLQVLDRYLSAILRPLFTQPLFAEKEIARLREEALTEVGSTLRYENIEVLGLEALEAYVFDATSYAHPVSGTVQGLRSITRDDVRAFYARFYRPENMIVGLSTGAPDVIGKVKAALASAGRLEGPLPALAFRQPGPPPPVVGREALVVAMPGAGATGLHAGYPIAITREHPDFWPLYVANVYFGTHRDSHGLLYQQIRNLRGYNYGAYSYIEHFSARPSFLFPPFHTPRRYQYFSIWIRPVSAEYAPHLLKALTWELENLVRNGVPPQDVALSKNKARTLYLNLAENTTRLLAARMDDAFYGMSPGYLDAYLERIDAIAPEQVNAALRKHLQYRDLKYVVVTDPEKADALAAALRTDAPQWGKTPQDYQIEVERGAAGELYRVPADKLEILRRDAVWAHYPLALDPARVHVLPVEALFETGDVPQAGATARPGAGHDAAITRRRRLPLRRTPAGPPRGFTSSKAGGSFGPGPRGARRDPAHPAPANGRRCHNRRARDVLQGL